jgi:hypothetical protein
MITTVDDVELITDKMSHKQYHAQVVFRSLVDTISNYNASKHGPVLIFEKETTQEDSIELFGCLWDQIAWDGVMYDITANCFEAVKMTNNQFGYTVVIENEPWIDAIAPRFRTVLNNAVM